MTSPNGIQFLRTAGKKKILNGKISKPTVCANVHEHKEDSSPPPDKEDKSPLEASNTEIAPSNASQIVPYMMKIMSEDEHQKRAALPEGDLLTVGLEILPLRIFFFPSSEIEFHLDLSLSVRESHVSLSMKTHCGFW